MPFDRGIGGIDREKRKRQQQPGQDAAEDGDPGPLVVTEDAGDEFMRKVKRQRLSKKARA